jgi:hypothetical protein
MTQAWAVTKGKQVGNGEAVGIGKRPPVYGGGLFLLFLFTRARQRTPTVIACITLTRIAIIVIGLLTPPTNAILTEVLSSFHAVSVIDIPAMWGGRVHAHALFVAARVTLEY